LSFQSIFEIGGRAGHKTAAGSSTALKIAFSGTPEPHSVLVCCAITNLVFAALKQLDWHSPFVNLSVGVTSRPSEPSFEPGELRASTAKNIQNTIGKPMRAAAFQYG
jgi:hypothetical protein